VGNRGRGKAKLRLVNFVTIHPLSTSRLRCIKRG
jgi:hypothetical protein